MVKKLKTVIEINGRKYDVTTGKLLEQKPQSIVSKTNAKLIPSAESAIVMDGIHRHPRQQTNFNPHPVPPYKIPMASQAAKPSQSLLPLHRTFNRAEKTQTLLRSIVKKPSYLDPLTRHSSKPEKMSAAQTDFDNKGFFKVPAERLTRARQTTHNMSVTRFGTVDSSKPKLTADLIVAKPPKKIFTAPESAPLLNRVFAKSKSKPQVFNHAIAISANHNAPKLSKEKLHKRVAKKMHIRPKILAISTAILAVIILGGFLAYQKIPTIAMRVAASQAGFNGHLPDTIPAGFSFKGPIIYSKGNISLNYKSNSDNRQFTINQKPTQWSSESLLTNFLVDSKLHYQTYQDKGLTIYVYNDGEATWVDNGVWYNVTGQGSLSTDQILSIAGNI